MFFQALETLNLKLIWANLIKDYIRMLQTKFDAHPSISSVETDV
jgi:hypothetical protein